MGDGRRFSFFADLIVRNFPEQEQQIADVAGGKGHLQLALLERGLHRVETWDKRPGNRRASRKLLSYRYQFFDYRSAPDKYDLVIGMHPDEGTDEIIAYAVRHRVPFAVCPCCILPSAKAYFGNHNYRKWCEHLTKLAERAGFNVNVTALPMRGRNTVIIGRPQRYSG